MNAGSFYDNEQITLIDHRPFSAINEVSTLDGYHLFPPKESHTIPAGTLVQLHNISYPSAKTDWQRPLYSPKENILVYLRVAQERGNVSLFREKLHVMIAPKHINNEAQLKTFLKDIFVKEDPNNWILKESSHIQKAIWEKKVLMGMNKQQIESSLGPPLKKQFFKSLGQEQEKEVWQYHQYYIGFDENKVVKIRALGTSSS